MSKSNHFEAIWIEQKHDSIFRCTIPGCRKVYLVLGPHLNKHYYREHKKKGGENNMSKIYKNTWKYNEVEVVLLALNSNLSEGQIRERLDNGRTADAIKGTIGKFFNYQEGRLADVSDVLQEHFELFVKKHPNEIPVKLVITETTVEQPETENEEVEKEVEEVLETATTFENLNQWFKDGGNVIMAHVKALVAEEVEQVKTESIKRLKDQQKELDRLREIEKKYNIIKQALA